MTDHAHRTLDRRPRISRAFVHEQRRLTFAAAAAELADEFGVREISVAMLCQLARSARGTFYELFPSGTDCMRFTAERGLEALFSTTPDPAATPIDPHRVTSSLCAAAAAEAPLVDFLLLHSTALPPQEGAVTPEWAVERLAGLLAARRAEVSVGPREDFVARIYLALIARRLREGNEEALASLPGQVDAGALQLLDGAPRVQAVGGSPDEGPDAAR